MLPLEIWECILGTIDCIMTLAIIRLVSKGLKALIDTNVEVWKSTTDYQTLLRPQVMMKRYGWSAYDLIRRSHGWKRFPDIFGVYIPDRFALPASNQVDLENWKRMTLELDITLLAWVPWEHCKKQFSQLWNLGDGTVATIFGSLRATRSMIVDSQGRYTLLKAGDHNQPVAPVQNSRYIYIHHKGIFCWEEGRTELTFICKSPFTPTGVKRETVTVFVKGMRDYLVFQSQVSSSRNVYAFKLSTLEIAWEFSYTSNRKGFDPFLLDEIHVILLNHPYQEQVFILDLHDGQVVQKFRKEDPNFLGSFISPASICHYLSTYMVMVDVCTNDTTTAQTRIQNFHFNRNQPVARCNAMETAFQETPYLYMSTIRFQDALISCFHWFEYLDPRPPGLLVYDVVTCSIQHYSYKCDEFDMRDFWSNLRFLAVYRDEETRVLKSCVVSIPYFGITKKKHKKRMMNR